MSDNCACGHVADEHERGYGHCTAPDCRCVHFDDEDEDD